MLASEIYQNAMGKKWRKDLVEMLNLLEEAGIEPVRTFRNGRGRSVEIADADKAKLDMFLKQSKSRTNNGNGHNSVSNDKNDKDDRVILLLEEVLTTARAMQESLVRIEMLWRT